MKSHICEKGIALIKHFESFKPFAYPDPGSELHKAGKGWGDKPATEIIAALPAHLRTLSGEPWTVGYGSTRWLNGAKIKPTDSITEPKGHTLFMETMPRYEAMVHNKIKVPLHCYQFSAITSFCYNAGTSYKAGNIWKDYNLFHNINRGMSGEDLRHYWEQLAITSGGVVLNGLVRRRRSEANLFLLGELEFFD